MAGLSDYAENALLNHMLGDGAWTSPTAYVALYTAAPTDAGGGTEVTGGSYARVTTSGGTWQAPSGGTKTNSAEIAFPTASASWGTVVAVGIFDASSGGNLLAWANLAANKTVGSGETAKFPAGDLDFTAD
jgi:hypothetical protein